MNESSAYRALAPSETRRTAAISQRCSQAGGGDRAGGAGGDGVGAGPAGGSGPADTAELTGVSSVIVFSITEPAEPNGPLPGEPLFSVDQRGPRSVRHFTQQRSPCTSPIRRPTGPSSRISLPL